MFDRSSLLSLRFFSVNQNNLELTGLPTGIEIIDTVVSVFYGSLLRLNILNAHEKKNLRLLLKQVYSIGRYISRDYHACLKLCSKFSVKCFVNVAFLS